MVLKAKRDGTLAEVGAVVEGEVVGGGAVGDGAVDDEVAVGHGGDSGHFVADEHGGAVGCELGEQAVDVRFEVLVDVAEGLVEHEELGVGDDGATEECALELTSGEATDWAVGKVDHLYLLQGVGDHGGALDFVEAFDSEQTGCDDLAHRYGEVRVDHILLWQVTDGGSTVGECD